MRHSFDRHRDAFSELTNIGTGRAAAALSTWTNVRVHLYAPSVVLTGLTDLSDDLTSRLEGEVHCITLRFSGDVSGLSALVLDSSSARRLVALLDRGVTEEAELDEHGRGILTEVGNVLLNSCVGTFSNLVSGHVVYGLAEFQTLQRGQRLTFVDGVESVDTGVWAETRFTLLEQTVSGLMAILATPPTVSKLVDAIEGGI